MSTVLVLWLYDPTATTRDSAVGWALYSQVRGEGVTAAYVDLPQLGFLAPAADDDPENHRVKALNLRAMVSVFEADGVRCLIVFSPTDVPDDRNGYASAIPRGALTICRNETTGDAAETAQKIRAANGGWPGLA